MKSFLSCLLLLSLAALAGAQTPAPTVSWTIGIFPIGSAPESATPLQILNVAGTAPTCNQPLPANWPTVPTTAFALTDAALTSATATWNDPVNANRVCTYPIFVWLNAIKGALPPGTYPSGIQAVSADGQRSAWVAGIPSFQRPVAPSLPPAAPVNFRIRA
jgi:hypothetical protein